jgi:formate dehydrogenase iron-sulfur subunit
MKAILNDVTRCTGCERCIQACIEYNNLQEDLPAVRAGRDRLSGRRLASIVSAPGGAYARKSCLHCLKPACVEACLVGALTKSPQGPVVYDAEKCIGCRYCMLACPFSIPRYEWDKTLPFITKCTMCVQRLEAGQVPACVEACPHEAIMFGERDELMAEAHRRIESRSDLYLPHVYGEREVGGTCVLYVSHVPLEVLGWPERVGTKPIPAYTWPVISLTPGIAITVASVLTGVSWIVQRRMKIAAEQAAQTSEEMPQHQE